MGAYHSRTQHKKFERGDWQLVAEHTDGRPNLLRHRLHCSQMEEYMVELATSTDVEDCKEVFYWRLGSECLVASINYSVIQQHRTCSDQQLLYLYLEKIIKRLNDLEQLETHEAVYALATGLQGFQQVYNLCGYVDIQPGMLCINADNKLKVWLNPDLAAFRPRTPNFARKKHNECEMVQGLFHQILKHTAVSFRHQFREYLAEMSAFPNFTEAQFLVKMFAKQHNIHRVRCLGPGSLVQSRVSEQLDRSDISLVKNSLSRMLNFKESDSISSKEAEDSKLFRSKHCTQPTNKTCSYKTTPNNNENDKFVSMTSHKRQQSAPPLTMINNFQCIQGGQRRSSILQSRCQVDRMETILSNLTTPNDSEMDPSEERDGITPVVVPIIPLKNFTRNPIPIVTSNSDTITFNENAHKRSQIASETLNSRPSSHNDKITHQPSTEDPPKISLKNLNKSRSNLAEVKFNGIRRTVSIRVKSLNQMKQFHALRNYASELAEPSNPPPEPINQIVSYEVFTSESESSRGPSRSQLYDNPGVVSNIQN